MPRTGSMKKSVPEYTLTLSSEQAREINKAVELLFRWKLKQDYIVTYMLLQIEDEEFCAKRDAIQPLMKNAMDIAMPDPPVGFRKLKDAEWYSLYNIFQAIRYAIHEAEYPDSKGVDSYPPIYGGGEPIPKCVWRLEDQDVGSSIVMYAVKKGKKYLMHYENNKADWCSVIDGSWMTHSRDMAEGFAKLTSGKVIEITLTERSLPKKGSYAAGRDGDAG